VLTYLETNSPNFSAKTLNIMVLGLKYTGLLWVLRLFTKMVGGGQNIMVVYLVEKISTP